MPVNYQLMRNVSLALLALCFGACHAYGQQEIIGHVMDEKGQPIPFVSIIPKSNKYAGTVSDKEGNFRAWVHREDTLTCTHIGFDAEVVPIFNNLTVLVPMHSTKPVADLVFAKFHVYIKDGPLTPSPRYQQHPPPPKDGEINYEQTFTRVEVPAQYPDGESGWQRYLNLALASDTLRLVSDVRGIVSVRYTIDRDGRASKMEILNSLTPDTDSLVIRALQRMRPWRPALQNGRFVETVRDLTVRFNIEVDIPADWHGNMWPAPLKVSPPQKRSRKRYKKTS